MCQEQFLLGLALFLSCSICLTATVEALLSNSGNFDLEEEEITMDNAISIRSRSLADEQLEPWQINEGTCPRALCGPTVNSLKATNSDPRAPQPQTLLVNHKSYPFFEGDIVLDTPLERMLYPHVNSGRSRRAIIKPSSRLWKYGIVPYKVNSNIGTKARQVLDKAMDVIQRKTCIQFVRKQSKHRNYLHITNQVGCWSLVGEAGGEQLLSLGRGCEHIGVVVHELGHALGFWHEQSRIDRDRYIKIIMKNVAPKYYSQFGKRDSREATSMSYAYDYLSVMHYKDTDFSNNHRKTIKVIGPGLKHKFKVGQRKGLSDVDIAQLKDMYNCNLRSRNDRVCGKGWANFKDSCYKFVHKRKMNFGDASDFCQKQKGYLVHINNLSEDKFLKNYLIKHYRRVAMWRVGAKRFKSRFMWYDGSSRNNHKQIKYKAWSPGYPKKFTTMTLALNKAKNKFVWAAAWAGSKKTPKVSSHPFICEAHRKDKCFKSSTNDGRDYRGRIDYTRSLTNCQRWTSQYPHAHRYLTGVKYFDGLNGLGNHGYCRNPGGRRPQPWCFTSKNKPSWEYCDVNIC